MTRRLAYALASLLYLAMGVLLGGPGDFCCKGQP